MAHDVVNLAKAAAYSGILTLFPALFVITALVSRVEEATSPLGGLRMMLEQFVPSQTLDVLQSSVFSRPLHSIQILLMAAGLTLLAGLGMMLVYMEGFRRAYRLPIEDWGFLERRLRALVLVPIAMLPLWAATVFVMFGHQIEQWMIDNSGHELHRIVLVFWRLARWSVALATSATVQAALYHFGTRRKESWRGVIPGAIAGTLMWFPTTLVFGWYVSRVANYSRFYGSFGAGIATMVWLFVSSFSVLLGAELNGWLYCERQRKLKAPLKTRPPGEVPCGPDRGSI